MEFLETVCLDLFLAKSKRKDMASGYNEREVNTSIVNRQLEISIPSSQTLNTTRTWYIEST
jgi:hypothetical protein